MIFTLHAVVRSELHMSQRHIDLGPVRVNGTTEPVGAVEEVPVWTHRDGEIIPI